MKTLSALNNQILQDKLKSSHSDIEFLLDDVTYQEGILEALKLHPETEALLIVPGIEGELDKHQIISTMREINDSMKIVLIVKAEDKEYNNWLAAKGVYDVFVDGCCSFDDIYDALTKKQNVVVKHVREVVKEYTEVEVEKIVDRTVSFKKLVLTVWDNAEFGCELAYSAAKLSGLNVMLIDLDLLAPKADLFMDVSKYPDRITFTEGIFNSSGLDIVIGAIEKNSFSSGLLLEASVKRRELDNLFILTGNYRLENYEYYSDSSLLTLIEKAYQSFDITVLLVNKSIYDSYTVLSLLKSDFNVVSVKADIDKLREFNDYIVLLRDKQHIPMAKHRFVTYEYKDGISLGDKILDEVTGHTYIGSVRHCEKRERYRNLKVPFVRRMDSYTMADYTKILEFFNIIPVKTFWDKVKNKLSAISIEFRPVLKLIKSSIRRVNGRRRRDNAANKNT